MKIKTIFILLILIINVFTINSSAISKNDIDYVMTIKTNNYVNFTIVEYNTSNIGKIIPYDSNFNILPYFYENDIIYIKVYMYNKSSNNIYLILNNSYVNYENNSFVKDSNICFYYEFNTLNDLTNNTSINLYTNINLKNGNLYGNTTTSYLFKINNIPSINNSFKMIIKYKYTYNDFSTSSYLFSFYNDTNYLTFFNRRNANLIYGSTIYLSFPTNTYYTLSYNYEFLTNNIITEILSNYMLNPQSSIYKGLFFVDGIKVKDLSGYKTHNITYGNFGYNTNIIIDKIIMFNSNENNLTKILSYASDNFVDIIDYDYYNLNEFIAQYIIFSLFLVLFIILISSNTEFIKIYSVIISISILIIYIIIWSNLYYINEYVRLLIIILSLMSISRGINNLLTVKRGD